MCSLEWQVELVNNLIVSIEQIVTSPLTHKVTNDQGLTS